MTGPEHTTEEAHTTEDARTAEEPKDPFADEAWRAAIEHAAGCPACRTPGAGCETGERLLRTYEEAARKARSEEGV
ncbi:hypothetical protein GCM10009548_55860 [Streptomyces malaysiensis subsp. malaysiensis]|uniref:Uncharacterized protein n=1 Tax=Streptomyces malaysiensis TaxID=92644 RepID=A0ABX6WEJ6_STRMQ|nr:MULTISPECIES: hypothetical protein [Streptomyces]QPI59596.1 hypothetical protein I1A49_36100 [Streptomyces solisilvae]UHH21255.1 hypothetical protein LUV23_36235 [Streptomyces sp. HNM0561]